MKQTSVEGREDNSKLVAMLQCAKVVLLVALCWGVASAEPEADEDVPDTNECAVTEVLVAMKKLLLLLSTEVRDLREQVKNSCQASGAAAPSATVRPITVTELVEKQGNCFIRVFSKKLPCLL